MSSNNNAVRLRKPRMSGPAIDRLQLWREDNNAPASDATKWIANLDKIHEPFFAHHTALFKV